MPAGHALQIPTEIGGMQALQQIYATLAGLKGALPESLGSLRSLNLLLLSGNKLEGPIPASFANLTQMEKLYLSYNALSGPIATICRLPALTEMVSGAPAGGASVCSLLSQPLHCCAANSSLEPTASVVHCVPSYRQS